MILLGLGVLAGVLALTNKSKKESLGRLVDSFQMRIDDFIKKYAINNKSFINEQTGKKIRVYKSSLINTAKGRDAIQNPEVLNPDSTPISFFKDVEGNIKRMTYKSSRLNLGYDNSTWVHCFEVVGFYLIYIRENRGFYLDHVDDYRPNKAFDSGEENVMSEFFEPSNKEYPTALVQKKIAKKEKEAVESKEVEEETKGKPETKQKPATTKKKEVELPKIEIIDYSEKALAIKGTTKDMAETIKEIGVWAKFNNRLKDSQGNTFSGWIFSKKNKEEVEKLVNELSNGDFTTTTKVHSTTTSNNPSYTKSNLPINQVVGAYNSYHLLLEQASYGAHLAFFNEDKKSFVEIPENSSYRNQDGTISTENQEREPIKLPKDYQPSIKTYLDKDKNLHIVLDTLSRKNSYDIDFYNKIKHFIVSPRGSVNEYSKFWKRDDLYKFDGGIFGVKASTEGFYRPAKKNGYVKDIVNSKQAYANIKILHENGYKDNIVEAGHDVLFKDKTPPTAVNVNQKIEIKDLTEIKLPNRVLIPKSNRVPFYDLSKTDLKPKRDVIIRELLLGKMEIATTGRYSGMDESFNSYSDYSFANA